MDLLAEPLCSGKTFLFRFWNESPGDFWSGKGPLAACEGREKKFWFFFQIPNWEVDPISCVERSNDGLRRLKIVLYRRRNLKM